MRSIICRKVRLTALLGAAILVCGTLMDSARPEFRRVDIQGTITDPLPASPLAISFYLNDKAPGCAPKCVTQYSPTIVGYAKEAIDGLAPIFLGGQMFQLSDLVDVGRSGQPSAVNTPFGIILVNTGRGAVGKPEVRMDLVNRNGISLSFKKGSLLIFPQKAREDRTLPLGTVVTRVLSFSGNPGSPNCHGQSVSALAHEYGGLAQAATALNYSSVDALQADIALFCGS